MEDRIYIRGSTAEFSVFKKITDVSWGVQHRTYLPVENSSWKNPTEEKVMLYVPLYDALGHDYGSQSTINFNKLALRYNIIDKEAEDYILEFLKLSISETEQVE
jgi:predicted AlkP superfamily pyrophosphatase or phosphodiesterase